MRIDTFVKNPKWQTEWNFRLHRDFNFVAAMKNKMVNTHKTQENFKTDNFLKFFFSILPLKILKVFLFQIYLKNLLIIKQFFFKA